MAVKPIHTTALSRFWTQVKAYLTANYASKADATISTSGLMPGGAYFKSINTAAYVVMTGVNGPWTLREWSNGEFEAWAKIDVASYAMTSAFATGGFYGPQLTQAFPVTFTAAPFIQITCITPNMGWGMIASPTAGQTYWRAINRTSATGAVQAHFYIKGTLA